MRPFDMMRALFLLIAFVIIAEMLTTIVGGLLCFWANVQQPGGFVIGACAPIVQQIREQWAEMLTAILALLFAFRKPPDKE